MVRSRAAVIFFVNDTATPEIYTRPYTLSLHDALPIAAGPTVVARGSRPLERGHPAARPARRLSRRQERALRVREAAQSTRLRLQTLLAVSRPAPGHRRLLPALWAELALRPSFPARVPGRGPRVGSRRDRGDGRGPSADRTDRRAVSGHRRLRPPGTLRVLPAEVQPRPGHRGRPRAACGRPAQAPGLSAARPSEPRPAGSAHAQRRAPDLRLRDRHSRLIPLSSPSDRSATRGPRWCNARRWSGPDGR